MPSKKEYEYDDDAPNNEYDDEYEYSGSRTRKTRLYYPTNLGGWCVNAVTGRPYPYLQGKKDELRLFKIIDMSCNTDHKGFLRKPRDPINKDPNFLYFDSPEQYMAHTDQEIPEERILKWRQQVQAICITNSG